MSKVTIPYYTVRRNGRGFWEPNKAMRAAGLQSTACGQDGPGAWSIASAKNDEWQAYRRGNPVPIEHAPTPGSIEEAWARYRHTHEWAQKAVRTREEWDRAWDFIKPVFGDCDPRTVSLEKLSEFRLAVENTVSLREAHRVIKIWRAAWKTWAAMKYCTRDEDPSLGVRNRAAAGRSETWSDPEARALIKQAWRMGYHGLSAALMVMWDSGQSPGDVRLLKASQIAWRGRGAAIAWKRAKTGKDVFSPLTHRASRVLRYWLGHRASVPVGDAPAFLNRSNSIYLKNAMAEDFREVRKAAFGEGEARMMLDFRRSASVEAINGGASVEDVARGLGNTISTSNFLFATYAPPDETSVEAVAVARKKNRAANNASTRVGTVTDIRVGTLNPRRG